MALTPLKAKALVKAKALAGSAAAFLAVLIFEVPRAGPCPTVN
jgi:hypothetical protein